MTGGHPGYLALVDEIRQLHLDKSGGYGSPDDAFANFTLIAAATGLPRYLYPTLRDLEKSSRILSLHAQGRSLELLEEFKDKASLNLCAAAMLLEDTRPAVRLHPVSDGHEATHPEGPVA